MIRFVNFLLTLLLIATLLLGGYWYMVTPQPMKMPNQARFAIDTALFEIQHVKVGKDDDKAALWREMSRQDNSAAQLHQAQLLFSEAKQNSLAYQEALSLLHSVADKGIPEGQNALGVMLREGLGGPVNNVEAYKWFSLAAARNDKLAEKNLLALSHTLSPAQMAEADNLAGSWTLDYLSKETEIFKK